MNEEAPLEDVARLLEAIAARKERLDNLRPLSPEALANLEHYYDIELTYASNAIEGNALSPVETTLVIEQGVTISGKPLKDHLEALDHYDAMRYVRELGRQTGPLTETDVRNLHVLVVQRSRPDIAGRYADSARRPAVLHTRFAAGASWSRHGALGCSPLCAARRHPGRILERVDRGWRRTAAARLRNGLSRR